ncbi:hypothetical protein SAMN04487910_0454 [Aquimarina amphilecti]|uniref:Uncharacterized protein n=1 Tax=Aquimarina amphilecti TaxID=1038014 RepID=A0A1H7GXV4_AQUAM|nr:hypothetical protein SAMN04487910_0454 [Aquimarina amphilecti]
MFIIPLGLINHTIFKSILSIVLYNNVIGFSKLNKNQTLLFITFHNF